MRIGFDVSKIDSPDGIGTFTRELLAALDSVGAGEHELIRYDLLSGGPDGEPLGPVPAQDLLDVFVANAFRAPRLAPGTRLFFVVHDLSFVTLPHCHTVQNRLHCLEGLIDTLTAGGQLLSVSRDGAAVLATWLGRDPASMPVLPLAPAPGFRPLEAEELESGLAPFELEPGSYVLTTSTLEPRKNLSTLLEAHAALPAELRDAYPLVMTGAQGWHNRELIDRMQRHEPGGGLKWLRRVDRQALVALYGGAAVFAYPSLAEGFGLPVVEAMACGAPVLTSNVSALPETAGGAARLVDPLDPAAMTAALAGLLASPAERRRLRALGLERAATLSWRNTARVLLDLLTRTSP